MLSGFMEAQRSLEVGVEFYEAADHEQLWAEICESVKSRLKAGSNIYYWASKNLSNVSYCHL